MMRYLEDGRIKIDDSDNGNAIVAVTFGGGVLLRVVTL